MGDSWVRNDAVSEGFLPAWEVSLRGSWPLQDIDQVDINPQLAGVYVSYMPLSFMHKMIRFGLSAATDLGIFTETNHSFATFAVGPAGRIMLPFKTNKLRVNLDVGTSFGATAGLDKELYPMNLEGGISLILPNDVSNDVSFLLGLKYAFSKSLSDTDLNYPTNSFMVSTGLIF